MDDDASPKMDDRPQHPALIRLLDLAHQFWDDGLEDSNKIILECCKELEAALRQDSSGGVGEEVVWLIERSQQEKQEPPIWFIGLPFRSGVPYNGMWTRKAVDARRFSSQKEAGEFARNNLLFSNYHVCEHIFLAAPQESRSEVLEAWNSYNASRMSGDEFACVVATILQLPLARAEPGAPVPGRDCSHTFDGKAIRPCPICNVAKIKPAKGEL